jgi:hypothetical protein
MRQHLRKIARTVAPAAISKKECAVDRVFKSCHIAGRRLTFHAKRSIKDPNHLSDANPASSATALPQLTAAHITCSWVQNRKNSQRECPS